MLVRLNEILTEAPKYSEEGIFASIPIASLFHWSMCTTAGFRVFTNDKVNAQLKRILTAWAQFLSSPASCRTLTTDEDGWFGPGASRDIPDFEKTFQCDSTKPYHGFTSWDDFFTRRFRVGVRPVHHPKDGSIITSACESVPQKVSFGIEAHNKFWIKGEPYSLYHMLHDDPLSPEFVGGTVYQAYLSHLRYHRWHSPVDGMILKIVTVPGTYYALSPALGFEADPEPDPYAHGYSQACSASIAARTLIFIRADNTSIGLMCFIAIGMAETSSCEATVMEGDRVAKGDELGIFHFGGSSYCLLFRPQTKVTFSESVTESIQNKTVILLNTCIATV